MSTYVPTKRRFSHIWEQIVVFALIATILGSLLIYIYAQREYTTIIREDYQMHRNMLRDVQQAMIRLADQQQTRALAALLAEEEVRQQVLRLTQKAPRLFRISCLDPQGNIRFGKEADRVTRYFQQMTRAAQNTTPPVTDIAYAPLNHERMYVVQLPLHVQGRQIGFLRGEFFPADSGATLIQITTVTLQIAMIAVGLMILTGIVLIFAQIVRQASARQQRLEASVVSLERANDDLRRTRHALQVSEKLASLGYLAAGIAHEIGNPLSAVLGYVELLQGASLGPEKTQDIFQRIEGEIERIRSIIQELVTFSHPREMQIQRLNVNDLLRHVAAQQPADPHKTIELELHVTEFPLFADVDRYKLQSVFVNILQNAADAIPGSGRIQISTSRRIRESSTMVSGSEVIAIQFSDTGSGIPEDQLARIFDPFFTTKDPGRGMGLGLALCHRIIESLDGEIEIESTEGEGTDVFIFLPPARPGG